jgi:hypothetical protein
MTSPTKCLITNYETAKHNDFYMSHNTHVFRCVCKIPKSDDMSFCPSIRPSILNSAPSGRFWWNLIFELFFRKSVENFHVSLKSDKQKNILREYVRTFMMIYRSILLEMRNVSNNSCIENQKTHFRFSNFLFRKSYRLWDNVEKYGRSRLATDDNITRRMRFAWG